MNRLNYDEHGRLLGEFFDSDQLLVILDNGEYYLTNFDINNHFEDNLRIIEKYDPNKVWTAVLYDADNDNYPYIKRFLLEASKKKQTYLGENAASKEILLSEQVYPRFLITFGGADAVRPKQEIDVEQFISVKGFKAKGKRLTTYQIERVEELEPLRFPEEEEEVAEEVEETEEAPLSAPEGATIESALETFVSPSGDERGASSNERGASGASASPKELSLFPDE